MAVDPTRNSDSLAVDGIPSWSTGRERLPRCEASITLCWERSKDASAMRMCPPASSAGPVNPPEPSGLALGSRPTRTTEGHRPGRENALVESGCRATVHPPLDLVHRPSDCVGAKSVRSGEKALSSPHPQGHARHAEKVQHLAGPDHAGSRFRRGRRRAASTGVVRFRSRGPSVARSPGQPWRRQHFIRPPSHGNLPSRVAVLPLRCAVVTPAVPEGAAAC